MSNGGNLPQPLQWAREHLKLVITVAIAVALLIVVYAVISWTNGINNDGFGRQRDVVTLYNQYQTELSTCLDNTKIGARIAEEEYRQVENVLTAVVGARYRDAGALSGDSLVSALAEQYPQIDRSLWRQLMTVAIGCRQEVAGVNGQLQHVAGSFDRWASQGGVFEKLVRKNWPDDRLKVVGLNGTLTGRDALQFIITPITTAEAQRAVQTHEMPSQDLFGDS